MNKDFFNKLLSANTDVSLMRWAAYQCVKMTWFVVVFVMVTISGVVVYAFLKNKGLTEIAAVISSLFTGACMLVAALLATAFGGKSIQSFAEAKQQTPKQKEGE